MLAAVGCGGEAGGVDGPPPTLLEQFITTSSWIEHVQFNNEPEYVYLPCESGADCRVVTRC